MKNDILFEDIFTKEVGIIWCLSAQYHRFVRRRGKKKSAVAVGHTILVISYCLLRYKTPYRELGADYFDRINIVHTTKHFVKRC